MVGAVTVTPFLKAEAFLDALFKLASREFTSHRAYRGQGDASLPLLPYILRPDCKLVVKGHVAVDFSALTNRAQILREALLLQRFVILADQAGLALPEDSQALRSDLSEWIEMPALLESRLANGEASWLPENLLALAAIAQHYGLPTRLLEWTRNPFVAAYFAASNARFTFPTPTELCVWALSPGILASSLSSGRRLETVATPYAGNPNIHAQSGVFLADRPSGINLDVPVDRKPWDEIALEQLASSRLKFDDAVVKFTLPTTEATPLLRRLRSLRVDASTVFPGFYGVVAAIKEEASL